MFGIVEDTSVDPIPNISFEIMVACASHSMSPFVPKIWIEVWIGTHDRVRSLLNRNVSKIPPFQREENILKNDLPWLGCPIDRSFTPAR